MNLGNQFTGNITKYKTNKVGGLFTKKNQQVVHV